MIEASDAAKLITFLASDCAEAVVGQAISCDGGADRGVDL
jgi:enoyl-[acyl-carrier-protein] reductase (NADH)